MQLQQYLVLRESKSSEVISFEFVYPLLREVLMDDLGRARTLMLQQAVAKALSKEVGPMAASLVEESDPPSRRPITLRLVGGGQSDETGALALARNGR